jgi:hypothetical protein
MKNHRKISHWMFVGIFILIAIGIFSMAANATQNGCLVGSSKASYRFGVTAPYSVDWLDLASLHAGGFLNWNADKSPVLPGGMDYLRILRVDDQTYPETLSSLPGWVASNPGSVWLVGNEPDRFFYQDSITAEKYAERYFELTSIIRSQDATAKIGFGTVIQPTPIRIRYLSRALDHLAQLAGGTDQAAALIDIWSIHNFILNEDPNEWGAGIPVGFENDYSDAIRIPIEKYHDTHSISIFSQRIIAFRQWMSQIGQKNKPLWITEYGSLFPPLDPPGGDLYNVSDQDTAAYMVATFDFLLKTSDPNTGLASDGDHLVQRWFWYSLNEHRYTFGGSFFDPDNGNAITPVGEAFIRYTSQLPVCYVPIPIFLK